MAQGTTVKDCLYDKSCVDVWVCPVCVMFTEDSQGQCDVFCCVCGFPSAVIAVVLYDQLAPSQWPCLIMKLMVTVSSSAHWVSPPCEVNIQ